MAKILCITHCACAVDSDGFKRCCVCGSRLVVLISAEDFERWKAAGQPELILCTDVQGSGGKP